MAQTTLELLEALMTGREMTAGELDDLLNDKDVSEDLHLEYKHGDELNNHKKASHTIRQYLSGFANSAGGTLIIGVAEVESGGEKSYSVTGCIAPGGGDLREWASRCLTPIASFFSPLPRFYVVEHPGGDVLVAATARSLGLVPCIQAGRQTYYLRLHDQTLPAEEYLLSDLMLGRRQRPHLQISDFWLENVQIRQPDATLANRVLDFRLDFRVENLSFPWAEDVRIGIISWAKRSRFPPIGEHLLSYIDVRKMPAQKDPKVYKMSHEAGSRSGTRSGKTLAAERIEPFEVVDLFGDNYSIPLNVHGTWYSYTWRAAVYLISKEAMPIWHQVNLEVDQELTELLASNGTDKIFSSENKLLKIKRLTSERPVVAIDGFRKR